MRLKWKLTVASLKMFFRQREAIIWTLLLPVFMIALFALVKFDGIGRLHIGVVNEAGGESSVFLSALGNVETVEITEGTLEHEVAELNKGERHLVLVIPQSFQTGVGVQLTAFSNEASPREGQLASLLVQGVLDEPSLRQFPVGTRCVLSTRALQGKRHTYIDFLLPGIISMSIMQMGIFGVAFSFVSLKKRGILRRLWVTPIRPGDFVLAQITMRLVVVMLQISLLVGVGAFFLDVHFTGSLLDMFIVGVLGAFVFLGFGFAIAGVSRSEDQVAPLANIIAMPMILLGGVFFSRSNLPGIVHAITQILPLTYLADAMRAIAIGGATLGEIGSDLLALSLWCVLSCVAAIRFFRWE